MVLPVVVIGLALFILAFIGLKELGHVIFGLISMLGLFIGIYLLWCGISSNTQKFFFWGCLLLLVSLGILVCLKSASGD